MKQFSIGWSVLASVAIWCALLLLAGCQAVIFSEGETSGMVEMVRGESRYCKLLTSKDVVLSEAVLLEFAKKCNPGSRP